MSDENNNRMPFDMPSATSRIIKVIGVGGGGGNAVNHMYREKIRDVSFVVCNTDSKALEESPVPYKLQLGHEGLGAGNRPEKAKEATEESLDEVQKMLQDGTKMVFITAGMGGGTGTGAAPLIAKIAKNLDILTVGIVTIPFRWEGHKKIDQALDGVEEISKNVDALLVINNEKLGEIYPNLSARAAFAKANDTLLVAAKSIAEIITMRGIVNLDFNDVKTVLKDGGVAIMSSGYGEGENRVTTAIYEAQHSPLLNNNDIFKSQKVLLNISYSSDHELMMEEMKEVEEFMNKFNSDFETKFGMAIDDTLGEQVKITLLATGFGVQDIHMKEMDERIKKKLTIEEEKKLAEKEEKEAKKQERRDIFYGKDTSVRKRIKHRRHIHIFSMEDLDNDNLISMVETVPTFSRSKDTLENIQANVLENDNQFNTHGGDEDNNVITFNND
ncbi:MAG: cell division protein FtsZ [Bacteroidaceae bacterium]|nr:cell division protein FtsZ [Bacteroidaceae bacterium]